MTAPRAPRAGSRAAGRFGEVVRGPALGGLARVIAAETRAPCEEARRRHDLWPTAAAAVGRALTAAALMALDLKSPGAVILRFRGDGPLRGVTAEGRLPEGADDPIAVRGYAGEPHVDLDLNERGKLDVGRAVGRGTLYVVRDMGRGEPYTGAAELVSGEIAEDLAHYFLRSEQRRTAVALGVLVAPDGSVAAAGGLVVELLPGAGEREAEEVEANLARLGSVTAALAGGADARELARSAAGRLDEGRLLARPVAFRCTCNRRRLSAALVQLGQAELEDMIAKDGRAELVCRFCAKRYLFSSEELAELLARARSGPRGVSR